MRLPSPIDRGDSGTKGGIVSRIQEDIAARSQAPGSRILASGPVMSPPSRPINLAPGAPALAQDTMNITALTQGDPRPLVEPHPQQDTSLQQDPSTLPFAEKRNRFRIMVGKAEAQQQTTPLPKAPSPATSAQKAPASAPLLVLQRKGAESAPSASGYSRGRRGNSASGTDSEGSESGTPTLAHNSLAAAAAAAGESAFGSPSLACDSSSVSIVTGSSLKRFLSARVSLSSTNGSHAGTPRSSTASSLTSSLPSSRRGSNASGSGSSGFTSRRASREGRHVQSDSQLEAGGAQMEQQLGMLRPTPESLEMLMSDGWHGNSSSSSNRVLSLHEMGVVTSSAGTQKVGVSVGTTGHGMSTQPGLPAPRTSVEVQTAPTPGSAVSTQTAPPASSCLSACSISVQAFLVAPGSAVSTQTAPPAVTWAGTQTVPIAVSSSSTQCSLAAPGSCISTQTVPTAVTSTTTQCALPDPALQSVVKELDTLTAAMATAEARAELVEAEAQQAAEREAAERLAHSATQQQLQLAQSAAAEVMGQVGELMVQVQVLKGHVVSQDDELDQLQGQIMSMQGQQTALVGQVSALEGQVASRGVQVKGLTVQLLDVDEERLRLQATLQEVLEATDATHLDGTLYFDAQLAPTRPKSVSFGTQSDPVLDDSSGLTTADPGQTYWDSQADAFELEPELLLLSAARESASSISSVAAAPTTAAAAAAAAQRPKVVVTTPQVVPSKPTSSISKAQAVTKSTKKTSNRASSSSSNSRAAVQATFPTGSFSCCMLLLVAACFLGCSSIGSGIRGEVEVEGARVTTTAAYVVGDSSSITVALYPLSQVGSQGRLNSHWLAGGTSKGHGNSASAMSWHAHVLSASSGAATAAAVAGSQHKGLNTAHFNAGQDAPRSVMPLAPGVTLPGLGNSTAVTLSSPGATGAVQVKARESACFAPLLPQCIIRDSTCPVVAPSAAAAPAWWLQRCERGETVCPSVPAAADATAARWWLQQRERGEASCPTSITTTAMWWQQKEGSQRELTTTAPAAPPSARTAPAAAAAAGAESIGSSSSGDRVGCRRLSPAVAEALEPASMAAALVLQAPWTYLTYQQGPAVRLAAQLSSGLFPFVIMGLVGHAFECS